MNIEDFKKIVETYQVGDELKLEALCSTWNIDADRFEQEEVENQLRDQTEELEDLSQARLEEIEALTKQLENNEQVLSGYRDALVKQNETIKVLRQALQEG